jgi:exodeoxyribonuclease III
MRLVTWNCGGAFRKKVEAIQSLNPDLAIIQECESPERLRAAGLAWGPQSIVWCGDLAYKGLAVISFTGARLSVDPAHDASLKLLLPVVVTGERNFRLLAVWTKEAGDRHTRYLGQAALGIQQYIGFFNGHDAVVAGDFNSNQSWDSPRRRFQHADMVATLAARGLVSAYHTHYREAQGRETHNTHYWRKRLDRPFHIDYCFVPESWTLSLRRVQIGAYEQWRPLSDHCPILVELDFDYKGGLLHRLRRIVNPS